MSTLKERIAEKIISIPDYPVKGIVYRDIMPVISDGPLFRNIPESVKETPCFSHYCYYAINL